MTEVNKVLTSSSNALVIVDAVLPPGGNKGDPLEIEVKLPPGSKASSLRGGTLQKCQLYNYDFAQNLRTNYTGGETLLLGHPLAAAEGPVLVSVRDGDAAASVKSGHIWNGGRLQTDVPFALLMNPGHERAALTSLIAERINSTFQAGLRGALDTRLASTKDNKSVALRVPAAYRLNLERYLRVVRLIPLSDSADMPGKGEDHRSYRQKLAEDLLDPSRTVVAALRLEALGQKSLAALREGKNSKHPLVRFCSAEAMAYLGSGAGGEELADAVVHYPILRPFALTALASLDEAICHIKLKELMQADLDDETRIGAFRALRALNEHDPLVRGELLNDAFWLHRVNPNSKPLVHVATTKRAEVVLFGETPRLKPDFSFLAGDFTITATKDDVGCTIARISSGCAPDAEAVFAGTRLGAAGHGRYGRSVRRSAGPLAAGQHLREPVLPHPRRCTAPSGQRLRTGQGRQGRAPTWSPPVSDLGTTPTLVQSGLPGRAKVKRQKAKGERSLSSPFAFCLFTFALERSDPCSSD